MNFPPESLIIYNARIHTIDALIPTAEALVCKKGVITFIGTSEEALKFGNSRIRCIDLKGKTVIPGFNDNHIHILSMGNFFSYPFLFGKNPEEIVTLLKEKYKKIKPGKKIIGFAWDYTDCPNPRKDILDAAFPDNPVLLRQYSGHAAWVNSRMLKQLKVSPLPGASPDGLKIERDTHGRPTGIIRGTVIYKQHRNDLLERVLNLPLHKRLLRTALGLLSEKGITSVQDNTWQPFSPWILAGLRRKNQLPVRFTCWPYGPYPLLAKSMDFCPWDKKWVRKGPWKYIVDGAFSPHTALLHDPYDDEPENTGIPVMEPEKIEKAVLQAVKHHRQLAFHAIGDRAVTEVIDAVERVSEAYPQVKQLRIRLEHAQIIRKQDLSRLKNLGMYIAGQPTGLSQPERDQKMLGDNRFQLVYPFKSILEAGIPLSFGSDFPGEIEFSPFTAIQAAVTRNGIHKSGTYAPVEGVTVQEAVEAYTMGSAHAEGTGELKGSLTKGKLADFIVLSDDIFLTNPDSISKIRVLMTVVNGRIVFSRR